MTVIPAKVVAAVTAVVRPPSLLTPRIRVASNFQQHLSPARRLVPPCSCQLCPSLFHVEREPRSYNEFCHGVDSAGWPWRTLCCRNAWNGKTATVKEVCHSHAGREDGATVFNILRSTMRLQRPHEYSLLWQAVSGQHASDHISAPNWRHIFHTKLKRLVPWC